ncbi:DUF5606 family protein [Niabella soli]|uniref:Uncharacterized protein n=1 Tax=Niabella soli DSM 19437 TaxID=929713 RepID=W0EYM0_9BACT|nr:DUF5606 domain-containing protein [Niabella soli]AHF15915.1 hypothetical protein NIASO_13595 [Niabella soli DSM 19437]
MEYNKLVAVSGLPGLYELISSKNDGAIVRSLNDQTTKFASSRIHQFSHLESIEIYTVRDNVNLVDVFNAMKASSTALPDVKNDKAIKTYFQEVYPDMDFERVYASDMKKMVKWFDILQKAGVDIKLTAPEAEEAAEVKEEVVEAEPKKKAAAKTKEAKTAAVEEKTPAKKTAAKKTAAKKSAEDGAAKK